MENPFGEMVRKARAERPEIRVISGVCTDCGATVPHEQVHLGWHAELEARIARLSTSVPTVVSIPRPFDFNELADGVYTEDDRGEYWGRQREHGFRSGS